MLAKYNIEMYSSFSIIKCSQVERINRSFRDLIMRHVHETNDKRWSDKLQFFTNIYNNRPHRTLKGMAPVECTKENEKEIYDNVYRQRQIQRCVKPKYEIGDPIRLSLMRKLFKKESEGNFTHEVYFVDQVLTQNYPCSYKLINWNKVKILGRVYENEMTKVHRPALFLVEKLLRRKEGQVLVKLKNVEDELWLDEKDVYDVKM